MLKKLPKFNLKIQKKVIFICIFIVMGLTSIALFYPRKTKSAITLAKATLSDSRFSYKSSISTTQAINDVTIDLDTDSADDDTNHLFPGDVICFANAAESGCHGNRTYTVASIVDSDTFTITDGLDTTLTDTDFIVATSSGTLTFSFTIGSTIPASGDIYITLPGVNTDSKTNDGFPDTNTSVSTNGFDIKGGGTELGAADIEVTGCTEGTEVVTAGGASADTTIVIPITAECVATTAVTITMSNDRIINPAPKSDTRTRGTADTYNLGIVTRDATDQTIESKDVMVAPVEAVFISATIDETLSFRVCGVKTDRTTQETDCFTTPTTICGLSSLSVQTYAYAVPFGTMTADTFFNAAQYVKASTNAASGLTVTIEESDEMGKDGTTCTGNPTAVANCIPDNIGDGTLDYNNSDDCDTDATNGLCYSADDGSAAGYDPTFTVKYNVQTNDCDATPTFCARSAADIEAGQAAGTLFSRTAPSSDSDAFVCWRLSVDAIQPAGYYYNIAKYVATPIF
jgi:hypothetical protein